MMSNVGVIVEFIVLPTISRHPTIDKLAVTTFLPGMAVDGWGDLTKGKKRKCVRRESSLNEYQLGREGSFIYTIKELHTFIFGEV